MFSYFPTNNIQISQFKLSFSRLILQDARPRPKRLRHRPVEEQNNKSNSDTNLQTGHTDNLHAHVFIMHLSRWLVFVNKANKVQSADDV